MNNHVGASSSVVRSATTVASAQHICVTLLYSFVMKGEMMTKLNRIAITMPDKTLAALEKRAEEESMTKSMIIRLALEDYLKNDRG